MGKALPSGVAEPPGAGHDGHDPSPTDMQHGT